jgi:class I fructose-bisphosphate aldolase/fructose-bisphosphate aldolase/2-amino-3,7-dideoxy-D-threo-hept-6-ulosonate synthase
MYLDEQLFKRQGAVNGLERKRTALVRRDGTLFLAAFDHPQIYGVMRGLEDPLAAIGALIDTDIDGFILNPGIFPLLDAAVVRDKKLVLRASLGGTMMGTTFADHHSIMASPQQALDLGADGILIMMVLGGSKDKESMTDVARAIEGFHRLSIPVMVEVLHADFSQNNDPAFIRNGARIAAELGADFVKAFYCQDFESVVAGCPVPIVLAGGPKEANILDIAQTVVRAGASGFAFGRNLFQHEEPTTVVSSLSQILRR